MLGKRLYKLIFGAPYSGKDLEALLAIGLGQQPNLFQSTIQRSFPKVAALCVDANQGLEPYFFANYPPALQIHPVNCFWKVWQAGRASLSTPRLFDPFDKGAHSLMDGCLVAPNPALHALEQAQDLWHYDRDIDLLVSVGTGLEPGSPDSTIKWLNDFVDVRDLVHEAHHEAAKILGEGRYFRFDPEGEKALDSTVSKDREVLEKGALRYAEKSEQLNAAARLLLAKSFYTDFKSHRILKRDKRYRFPIRTRAPDMNKNVKFSLVVVPAESLLEEAAATHPSVSLAQLVGHSVTRRCSRMAKPTPW